MPTSLKDFIGLTDEQVHAAQKEFGFNTLHSNEENVIIKAIKKLITDPMVIMLLVASSIYFAVGQIDDGIFLTAAIILVAAISLFQDSRAENALEKLKSYTNPKSRVIRNGQTIEIESTELVIGDYLIVEEGESINADGEIIYSSDFSVNESILTGESFSIQKNKDANENQIFQGTYVATGMAIVRIIAIGKNTKLGIIGKSLENIKEEKTPLESKINNFVIRMSIVGGIVFIIVWGINFYQSQHILESLLKALTLAMSILPEEIPVAFSTFMALGAWRMLKTGIVIKQMKTVETLGSATVICTDKTGTLTENKMSLAKIYTFEEDAAIEISERLSLLQKELISIAMWASEPIPFDPMEKALHEEYSKFAFQDERKNFNLTKEYPLEGTPPMMTHIFKNDIQETIIASKGAPEAILKACKLSKEENLKIQSQITTLSQQGYRVLGVGTCYENFDVFPPSQEQLTLSFKGLLAFYDPPKKNIAETISKFKNAGIKVKIITGDNLLTTKAIAQQIGLDDYEKNITGDQLMTLTDDELRKVVANTTIFSRMYPEAKLRIISALKKNNEIVAMLGDGVNDGPALKAAHIGVAMGQKGTEIAKQAASLILMEDDFSKLINAIGIGRKIYTNLKKAIQFIISIHIPIILSAFVPLAFGWAYPNIFLPIHIIFFELIMGPTCSIIYENEPMEPNTLNQKPRPFSSTFFKAKELATSIVQGLVIAAFTLGIYQFSYINNYGEDTTRTMTFTTLIVANIFLTLINRSFYYSALTTLKYRNNLMSLIIGITILSTGLLIYYEPFAHFFMFSYLNSSQLAICLLGGFTSVVWFEGIKWIKRSKNGK